VVGRLTVEGFSSPNEGLTVRSFPSAGRRRWAAASLAVLTVAGLAVPLVTTVSLPWASAADGDNLKKKQAQVQADIADAGHELEESSNELAAAAAALSRANQAYESAQATLSSANAELAAATRTLEAANAKLDVARAALAKAEAELAAARAEDARLKEALVAAEAEYAQAQVDVATGKEAVATQKLKVKATINEIIE
jgi:chromosome segregation ATPase